jgi:hypothetical protein
LNLFVNPCFRELLKQDTFESAAITRELLQELRCVLPQVDSSADFVAAYFTTANVAEVFPASAQEGLGPVAIGKQPVSVINITKILTDHLLTFCKNQFSIKADEVRSLRESLGVKLSDIQGISAERKKEEKKSAEAGLENAVEECLKLFPAPALGKPESNSQREGGQQQSMPLSPQILALRLETFKFFMQGNECKFFDRVRAIVFKTFFALA